MKFIFTSHFAPVSTALRMAERERVDREKTGEDHQYSLGRQETATAESCRVS